MKSLYGFCTIVFLCWFLVSCVQDESTTRKPDDCPASFYDFAYGGGIIDSKSSYNLPVDWGKIVDIPVTGKPHFFMALIRKVSHQTEIWVFTTDDFGDRESGTYKYFIYTVETKQWRTVSRFVEATDAFVDGLFVSADGTIWAHNAWDARYPSGHPSAVREYPVLSRFNDGDQVFEFAHETQELYPYIRELGGGKLWNNMIYSDNALWMFTHNAIYSYDLGNQTFTKHLEIQDYTINYHSVSPENNDIYLQVNVDTDMAFTIMDGEYLRYSPATNKLVSLGLPPGRWPASGSILVDHSGNLWLSAVGWRSPDGYWHLLHPDTKLFIQKMKAYDYSFAMPTIIFESADGRLWFNKNGTAWLDPESMQGCWFTLRNLELGEDENKNLWTVVDQSLYMLPHKP